MSQDGKPTLTQHDIQWFTELGLLIGSNKFFATSSGQAKETLERYEGLEHNLAVLKNSLHCDVSAEEKQFLGLDKKLNEALQKDNADLASETKTKLGELGKVVANQLDESLHAYRAAMQAERELAAPLQRLKKVSATQGTLRGEDLQKIHDGVELGPNTVATLQKATSEYKVLGKAIGEDLSRAEKVIKAWETDKTDSNRLLEQARGLLRLEQNQLFLECHNNAVKEYELNKDALLVENALTKLQKEVKDAYVAQQELQREYQVEKQKADKHLETYLKVASPSDGGAALQQYGAISALARINNYTEAIRDLQILNGRLDKEIQGQQEATTKWEKERDELLDAINKAIDEAKKKDGGKWASTWDEYNTAILNGDLEYTAWLGNHLKDHEAALKGLTEIKDVRLAKIQKEFEENDTAIEDATQRLKPYELKCEEVAKKIGLVVTQIGGDEKAAKKALGDIPTEQRRAVELPKTGSNYPPVKTGEALDQAIKEGEKILEGLAKRLDTLLSKDSVEGQEQLQGIAKERELWELQQKTIERRAELTKEWNSARGTVQVALDDLAQVGGDTYIKLLDEFEKHEQEVAEAGQQVEKYLALFPKADAVAKGEKMRDTAWETFIMSTTAIGDGFLKQITGAKELASKAVEQARVEFGKVLDDVNSHLKNEKWWTFGNSASSDFRTKIRTEAEGLAAYRESNNLGALQTATAVATELLTDLKALLDKRNTQSFKDVIVKIKELQTKIDDATLKSCKPTLQAKLAKQYEGGPAVEAKTLWHVEAMKMLVKFERELLTPALEEAERIKTVRDKLNTVHDNIAADLKKLAEKMNKLAGKGFAFPIDPPNCGEQSKRLASLKLVISTNEVAGVVEGGFKRLEELAQQVADLLKLNEQDLEQFAVGAKKQVDDDAETAKNLAKQKQELIEEIDKFSKTNFEQMKKAEPDSDKIKQAEQLIETAKKSAEAGEVMSAKDQLHTLRQMAGDSQLMDKDKDKKSKKLESLATDWDKLLNDVTGQFVALRDLVEKEWKADPNVDQKTLDAVIKKLPEAPNLLKEKLDAELRTIDEQSLPISERKKAREKVIKTLRHNYAELTNNPIYKHLRENKFDQPVGIAALVQFLANFETKVLTTL